MAADIRDLEDQLYEYDHEYKLLEQQLGSMRREVAHLRSSPPAAVVPKASKPNVPLEFLPRDTLPAPSTSKNKDSQKKGDSSPPSILLPSNGSETPPNSGLEALRPEPIEPESIQPQPVQPEPILPQPSNSPAFPPPQPPPGQNAPGPDIDFDVEGVTVPSINSGASMPPSLPTRNLGTAPENDLDLNLSQIELPTQLAATPTQARGASISHATQVVTDTRVVEFSIHPNLSRAVNFDEDGQDDGLFLVLLPKNTQGQFVAAAAALTVEVFDPSRDDEHSRIGLWSYSPSEVSSKVQPIGSQQGIHLTLPWNGPNPKSDRVVVHCKYTFENGRQLVAHKEIFVNAPGALKTVWAPRAGFPVQNASGTMSAPNSPSRVRPAGAFPTNEMPPGPTK